MGKLLEFNPDWQFSLLAVMWKETNAMAVSAAFADKLQGHLSNMVDFILKGMQFSPIPTCYSAASEGETTAELGSFCQNNILC